MNRFYESQLRVWLRNMIVLYRLREKQTDPVMWAALDTALRYAGKRLTQTGTGLIRRMHEDTEKRRG